MGFGDRLQREREMRGITLDEIAGATKISTRSLRALEEEDFHKLPGGIFNKGFVRAYARYLGLDEEQAVADYLVAVGEADSKGTALESEHLKKLEAHWQRGQPLEEPSSRLSVLPQALGVFLLLVLVLLAWHYHHQVRQGWQQWKVHRHPASQNNESTMARPSTAAADGLGATSGSLAPSPAAAKSSSPLGAPGPGSVTTKTAPAQNTQPGNVESTQPNTQPKKKDAEPKPNSDVKPDSKAAATAPSAPASTTVASADAAPEFVVHIRTLQESWLSIVADGKRVRRGVVKARHEESVRARQKILLVAGNAGAVEVSFNGTLQAPLGAAKEVRTVTFTPEGMQDVPTQEIPQEATQVIR